MRFTKPSWVAHHDNHDPHKRMSIFSVSVHPDGSRVATGGLDARIRIWSTSPILSQKAEEKGQHKSLSTLTMHTGPVLVVRWAASGKWLASGSDDTIVMIWDLDPNGGGKVWGSDDVNVEGWKALRRLTGHESDVVDCAWSPSDRYLASVGLDSKVFIWCGYTLECIRRLDGHQGFVKGVCWDPVGEYLATQSDDKTVNIWRSTDWRLETTVSKPYETSPGSTFFNRLSWSPDASYICTSNAMNSNAVFVAAIVERDTWNSSVSLVGHENTIQVASYNPRLFRRNQNVPLPSVSPTKRSTTNFNDSPSKRSLLNGSVDGDEDAAEEAANVFSVVALGADDRSISIWRTTDARPLVVAKEAFDRQILDLSWSADGRSLWACSADGSIAVLDFSDPEPDGMMGIGSRRKGEMEGLTTAEETKAYLGLFDFPWPPPLEANHMHMQQSNGYQQNARSHYQMDSYAPEPHHGRSFPSSYNASQSSHGGPGMPSPVRPNYLTSLPSSMSTASAGVPPPPINQAQKVTLTKSGKKRIQPTFLGGGAGVTTSSGAMPPPSMTQSNAGIDRRMEWAPDGSQGRHGHSSQSVSSRHHAPAPAGAYPADYGYQLAPGSRMPGSGEPRVLAQPPNLASPRRHSSAGFGVHIPGLELPPLRTHVSAGMPGELVFEARNSDDSSIPTEVVCAHGTLVLWTDYVPARVLSVVKTPVFYAASLDDCSLIVYTPAGRRAMPTISLDAPVAILAAASRYLMAITSTGFFYTWNVQTKTSMIPPASIASQVTGATGGISLAKIYDNGASLITFASGTSIAWDQSLNAWVRLAELWWHQQPPSSQSHRSSRPSDPSVSPTSSSRRAAADETPLGAALALGSLETRLHAARILGSPADYRAALMVYAGKLADDSLAERADELVRELCGPVFWDPSKLDPTPPAKWEPKVLGMNKRDLLQDVLPILARGRSLSKMAQDWQVLLARIESERDM